MTKALKPERVKAGIEAPSIWLQRSSQCETLYPGVDPTLWERPSPHTLPHSLSTPQMSMITQQGTILKRHILLADACTVWAIYPVYSVRTTSALSPHESLVLWIMIQLSSVTKLPDTFKNHFTGVTMMRKQATQKHLLRGQLEGVLSNYRSAAFPPISSLQSQQIQHLEEKNKKALRKSPVSEWEYFWVLRIVFALWASHLLPCQLLAKAHRETTPWRKDKRVVLFSILDLRDLALNTYFIKPSLHLCPVIVFNITSSVCNW